MVVRELAVRMRNVASVLGVVQLVGEGTESRSDELARVCDGDLLELAGDHFARLGHCTAVVAALTVAALAVASLIVASLALAAVLTVAALGGLHGAAQAGEAGEDGVEREEARFLALASGFHILSDVDGPGLESDVAHTSFLVVDELERAVGTIGLLESGPLDLKAGLVQTDEVWADELRGLTIERAFQLIVLADRVV